MRHIRERERERERANNIGNNVVRLEVTAYGIAYFSKLLDDLFSYFDTKADYSPEGTKISKLNQCCVESILIYCFVPAGKARLFHINACIVCID